MFENCTTLAELTAERVKLSATVDLVELNNAYNTKRSEILQKRSAYTRVDFIPCKANDVIRYCGIPIVGKSPTEGVIRLTDGGFEF